jgi:hypothetical protein
MRVHLQLHPVRDKLAAHLVLQMMSLMMEANTVFAVDRTITVE